MPQPNEDHEPWRVCYRQLAPKLLLFARQWLPTVADAEDVVQTAFVRFWRKYPEAQAEHYPLLYAAVRTAALDLIRSNDRRNHREENFSAERPEFAAPLFESSSNEETELIQSALQRLPPEQRETLVLRVWGELTFAEIATTLGESINTVAARHRYALQSLRRILNPVAHERV